MADIAAYLVDELLPEAPYRQWVLTFPWPLRFRLAVDRALLGKLLGIFLRTVFAWQRQRGRALGIRDGQTGSVSFVQRFGGALNLNPHVHSLLPDGLFVPGAQSSGTLAFVPLPEPTQADIEALTFKIAHRLTAAVEKLCADDDQTEAVLERTAAALRQALATALEPPLPKLGRDLLGLDPQAMSSPLCARIAGFSLHAARVVHAHNRDALESLCRYGLRAPLSQERLTLREDGRVVYHLRRPWPNSSGANCLVLQPIEFLRRLAALVPAPYANLVRYHGVFAGRSRWHDRLPVPPSKPTGDVDAPQLQPEPENRPEPTRGQSPGVATTTPADSQPDSPSRTRHRRTLPWAQLLRRVFFLDALTCPRCDTAMVVLALISDLHLVQKILRHLELPADLPTPAPAVLADDILFDHLDAGAPTARPPP
jgi:hypothetical protein